MTFEVITKREELPAIAARWDALAREDARDGFFRTFVWYQAWLQHVRPDADPFVVVARDEHGEIIGLAPLCQLTYADLGFRLKALSWGGREVVSGDFLDVLAVAARRAEITQAIYSFVWEHGGSWGLLVMGELVDGADSYTALQRLAERSGASLRRQEDRLCPYIELPATFDDYLGTLGTSTRYHIRRRMRDVEKKGGTVQVFSDSGAIVERLDTLVRLHIARWQKDNQPGTFGRPGFVPFLKHVFMHPPEGASWRLYELEHDGRQAASLLMFYFGESALYYQAGWDPDSALSSLSPGVVLMAHSIRDAVQHGRRYYEFLRGDEAYKSRWTKTSRTTATLLLARSPIARGYLQTARLKDAVKNHALFKRHEATKPAEGVPDSAA